MTDSGDRPGGAGGGPQPAGVAPDELRGQINKRITMNLLISGAGMHTFLTSHHLVRKELDAISRWLVRCYDPMIVALALNYHWGDAIMYGWPGWFWRRTRSPRHPFREHRLLATHGLELNRESCRYLARRGWRKGALCLPIVHYLQATVMTFWALFLERKRTGELEQLAVQANAEMWGIPADRLKASLTRTPAFGYLRTPRTWLGKMTRAAVIGYGGVVHREGGFDVVAKAWVWPLLSHELTKGVIELVCLHGLNELDEETYEAVIDEADQLEYEVYFLQTGAEVWRRFLSAIPPGRSLSETLMHVARLEPEPLERLMMRVVEDPEAARPLLAEVAGA